MITIHKFAVYCFCNPDIFQQIMFMVHFVISLLFCLILTFIAISYYFFGLELCFISQVGYKLLFKLVNLFVISTRNYTSSEYSRILNINFVHLYCSVSSYVVGLDLIKLGVLICLYLKLTINLCAIHWCWLSHNSCWNIQLSQLKSFTFFLLLKKKIMITDKLIWKQIIFISLVVFIIFYRIT